MALSYHASTRDAAERPKLVFPGVTSLAGKAFMVIEKGGKIGEHAFGLATKGDVVTLLKPDLTPVSHVPGHRESHLGLRLARGQGIHEGPDDPATQGAPPR